MRPTGRLHLGHLVGALQNWERLQADYDAVCDDFGLARSRLEVRNASEHGHYAEHYDDGLVAAVGELYREDVERFGYAFGD